MHRLARFPRQVDQPLGIIEQELARRRDMQPLALAHEEVDAELALELAHARGDVGLHAVELFRGPRHAAGLDDGAEDMQVAEIHHSHPEIVLIIIIHFT